MNVHLGDSLLIKHRFGWHAVIALLIGILLALFLVIELRTQIPVDLRMEPAASAISLVGVKPLQPEGISPRHPAFELMAGRRVLNDLLRNVMFVENEANFLEDDADHLWNYWRNYVGVYGSPYDWSWKSRQKVGLWQHIRGERVQAQIFDLDSTAQQLHYKSRKLIARIHDAETQWWILNAKILHSTADKETAHATSQDASGFKDMLSNLVNQMNDIDAQVRAQQQQMTEVYDRMSAYFDQYFPNQFVGATVDVRKPWHWNYMMANTPRPDLQYNFQSHYEEYLSLGSRELEPLRAPQKLGVHW